MHTGWLLIICGDCCLHSNPIWSELSPRSPPNPQSSAAWLQRFPLCRFLFVALRGLSTHSLQNDKDCLRLANPAPGVREARGEGDVRSPAPGERCPGCVGGGQRSPAATAGLQIATPGWRRRARSLPQPLPGLSGQYSRHSAAGADLKVAASETPDLKKIY